MKHLGHTAEDKVTGFKGVITAKASYLYGCTQYLVIPKVNAEGKRLDGEWFDEGRLVIGDLVFDKESVQAAEPGCELREYPTK